MASSTTNNHSATNKHENPCLKSDISGMNTNDLLAELRHRLSSQADTAVEVAEMREKVATLEKREKEVLRLVNRVLESQYTSLLKDSEIHLREAISLLTHGKQEQVEKSSLAITSVSSQPVKLLDCSRIDAVNVSQKPKSKLHFTMFLGSVRESRNADRVKKYLLETLELLGVTVTVFDPAEYHYDKLIQPLHYYPSQLDAPQQLRDLSEIIRKADGHIIVTPEYHACMGPSLATLMGQFAPLSFSYRPAAIVSYSKGRYGGLRAAMQLRTYLSEMGLIHVPSILAISHVEQDLSPEGKTLNPDIFIATAKIMEELMWFAEAVKEHAKDHELLYRGKLWSDHGPNRNPKPNVV